MNHYLSPDQIEELISQNRYLFTGNKYQSRCFTGNYENSNDLPALALPGGDMGELSIVIAASLNYAFDCDLPLVVNTLKDIVGKGYSSHYQHSIKGFAEECRHLHFLSESPEIYSLQTPTENELFSIMEKSKMLSHDIHFDEKRQKETACVIVQGDEGILPHYLFETYQETLDACVFVYHKKFVDERRKLLAQNLYVNKAVTLYDGLDQEYLYEAMSEIGDAHLYETLNRIDPLLPIFSAELTSKGSIKIEKYS